MPAPGLDMPATGLDMPATRIRRDMPATGLDMPATRIRRAELLSPICVREKGPASRSSRTSVPVARRATQAGAAGA